MDNYYEVALKGLLTASFFGAILSGFFYLIFRPIFLWFWRINRSIINQERTIFMLVKLHKKMGGQLTDKEFEYLFYNADITLTDLADEANDADNNGQQEIE